MKTNKILKVMCTIIIIMLLVVVSFVGIYVYQNGRMVNLLKEFTLGMEFGGGRQIILSPTEELEMVYTTEDGKRLINTDNLSDEELAKYIETQESVNPVEVLNVDNYKKAKDIFKTRLNNAGVSEYEIALDEESGNIIVNASEKDSIDEVIYTIFSQGEFIIQDTENLDILLDNSDLKDARVAYYNTQAGTSIYLTIELNEEGAKKLEEISQVYVESTDEEGNKTTKTVTLYIDGQAVTTTYFGETMTNGMIQLSIGTATTDSETLTTYLREASNLANLLSTGLVDIHYDMSANQYMGSAVSENVVKVLLLAAVSIVTAMMVYTVIEYKERGIIASATFLGFIAALILAVRLSNVVITVESITAIILAILFDYVFINILLAKLNKYKEIDSTPKSEINRLLIRMAFTLIPAVIIMVVFCLIPVTALSSFGTAFFWGIAMLVVYTLLITKPLLLNFEYLFEE